MASLEDDMHTFKIVMTIDDRGWVTVRYGGQIYTYRAASHIDMYSKPYKIGHILDFILNEMTAPKVLSKEFVKGETNATS